MKHILIEADDYPHPNQPLILEQSLDRGRWKVSDSRTGLEFGVAYAVQLGAESIERLDARTTVYRIDE